MPKRTSGSWDCTKFGAGNRGLKNPIEEPLSLSFKFLGMCN